jgi:hypothetical protein
VDPRAARDEVEKRKFLTVPGLEPQPLGRLPRSQSLYRLRYPGFLHIPWYFLKTLFLMVECYRYFFNIFKRDCTAVVQFALISLLTCLCLLSSVIVKVHLQPSLNITLFVHTFCTQVLQLVLYCI